MSLNFQSQQLETAFDAAASEWTRRYRCPSPGDLPKVLQRAFDTLKDAYPSVSGFERAYRELVAEGQVSVSNEKFVAAAVITAPQLTADEYHKLSANEVIRRYRLDRQFKSQVDLLCANGEI